MTLPTLVLYSTPQPSSPLLPNHHHHYRNITIKGRVQDARQAQQPDRWVAQHEQLAWEAADRWGVISTLVLTLRFKKGEEGWLQVEQKGPRFLEPVCHFVGLVLNTTNVGK